MKITNEYIDYVTDIMATQITEKIAAEKSIPIIDALKYLMCSKTYKLFLDKESLLYTESVEYILDMLNAEELNDIPRLLEV
jgi:hypothetical protein